MEYLALYLWLAGALSMWAAGGMRRSLLKCLCWPIVAPIIVAGTVAEQWGEP